MCVTIRKFEENDIKRKVQWINNPANNQFLHYDIPITEEGTRKWFESHRDDNGRYDAVIEVDGIPVGTIGLLSIDRKNSKAEYYIAMGETEYKGKGIAKEASTLILEYGFITLGLNRIYLFTELKNKAAQKLFETVGFKNEGLLREDIKSREGFVDRLMYSMLKKDWGGIAPLK